MVDEGSGSGRITHRRYTNGTFYMDGGEFCFTYVDGEGSARNEFHTGCGMGRDPQVPDLFVAVRETDGSGRPDQKTHEPEFPWRNNG